MSSLPLPPHSPSPTVVSGSDSSDGLRYSLCFLFFMGLRSSEGLAQEFWPEAFSTMTDLREGQPEGKNHRPTRHHPAPLLSHEQEWCFEAQKQSKQSCKPCPLPLLEQLGTAIMGGTRIWTRASLRFTSLALTAAIILWGGLRGIFFCRVLGEVRCRGQRGLRPPTPSQPHPGSAHLGAHDP